jgi:hypothetical protein
MTERLHSDKDTLFAAFSSDIDDRKDRISYPLEDVTETITDRFRLLRKGDSITTLVDGAFDVPHPNHEWYLRHCRLLGAKALLNYDETPVTSENLATAAGSSRLNLAVTVDADHKISHKKGGKADKGGVPRPVYPWTARANRIAGYMFKTSAGLYRPVADLVTVEGDPLHEGTALESSLTLARSMADEDLLDNLVVYGEHEATVQEARDTGLEPLVIPTALKYETNPQTGQDWSSSELIARAQGKPAPYPTTRPTEYS